MWTLFFYMYANYVGSYDLGHFIYPYIDWRSYPATIAIFVFAICLLTAIYYGYCVCMDNWLKRRGSQ